jgi:hypothetical protein
MNLRLLGVCAIAGAPFLLIAYISFGGALAEQKTALDGFYSLLYITGLLCSVIGLWHAGATGINRSVLLCIDCAIAVSYAGKYLQCDAAVASWPSHKTVFHPGSVLAGE